MPVGSLTQFREDASRLPTGICRIGYDTDTERYTFQDEYGVIYESEPGNAYGLLKPVSMRDGRDICRERPNAFDLSNSPGSRKSWSPGSSGLNSFDEFLPSAAITFTSSPWPPEQGNQATDSSRLSRVSRNVKSMKSAVSQLQAAKSEGKPNRQNRHSKSLSLLSNFGISRSPSSLLNKSKRSREYSEIQDKSTDDGSVEAEDVGLLQPSLSSNSSLESYPSSSWSSSRPESFHQNASISHSGKTLSEGLKVSCISATSIGTPMRAAGFYHTE